MADNYAEEVNEELDITIDEHNLVVEWKRQSELMFTWGLRLADAILVVDEAKARLGVVVAELGREIREDPAAYGLQKATESTVPAAVLEQPEHIMALKKYNKAKYRVKVLQGAIESIDNRKASLKGMTDLFNRQWFADPTTSEQPEELRTASKTVTRRKRRRPSGE